MWTPTHVKVTVHRARNLKARGHSDCNDSYVVLNIDDSKFTTSVKTKNKSPEWNEDCDLPIPTDLQNCVLHLTVLHRNLFSLDEFLGETNIFLQQFSVYGRPQSRWYSLANKRGSKKSIHDAKNEEDVRGEVQVTVTFMVQSKAISSDFPGHKLDRQKSLSFRSLANLVGKKLTNSWSSQTELRDSRLTDLTDRKCPVHSMLDLHNVSRSFHHLNISSSEEDAFEHHHNCSKHGGVSETKRKSEQDDNQREESIRRTNSEGSFTERCNKDQDVQSPVTSVPGATVILRKRPVRPLSLHTLTEECADSKNSDSIERINNAKNSYGNSSGTPVYSEDYVRAGQKRHSYIGCGEIPPMVAAYQLNEIEDFVENEKKQRQSAANPENITTREKDPNTFEGYDRDDLIKLILEQQSWIKEKRAYVDNLEDYIDALLIRVLDNNQQLILENPYNRSKHRSHQLSKSDNGQKNSVSKIKKKHILDFFKIWKQ